jgi:predicted HicB family RNase H-like nuclease
MKKIDPQDYEISIRKTHEDGETLFKATVRELPDVAVYEDTYNAAYDAVCVVIQNLYEQARENKREFPAPYADEAAYTGRVTLRMPRHLHRQIAAASRAERVSLNHLITTALATYVGTLMTHTHVPTAKVAEFDVFGFVTQSPKVQQIQVIDQPADTTLANPWQGATTPQHRRVLRRLDLGSEAFSPVGLALSNKTANQH